MQIKLNTHVKQYAYAWVNRKEKSNYLQILDSRSLGR